jgi:hypothetical protein
MRYKQVDACEVRASSHLTPVLELILKAKSI